MQDIRHRVWVPPAEGPEMRFGALFPTQEIGTDPVAIRDYAQTVEDLGFDHPVGYDHVLGAVREPRDRPLTGPYDQNDLFHEPLVLSGYLAAVDGAGHRLHGQVPPGGSRGHPASPRGTHPDLVRRKQQPCAQAGRRARGRLHLGLTGRTSSSRRLSS